MSGRRLLPLALLLAVIVRVPFWIEALRTPVDGDTAIIGLMAHHLGRGTTMWGQPYGSPLEAWLAAPLVAAMGPRAEPLRLTYFLLGLGLVPLAYALGAAVDPRAAMPAAILMACPSPYLLLLSSLPPPMYPLALLLAGGALLLAVHAGAALASAKLPWLTLVAWGIVAGLAVWTHLMTAAPIAAAAGFLIWRARYRPRVLLVTAAALVATSAPLWLRALRHADAFRAISLSGRRASLREHLAQVVPKIHLPVGGLVGTHAPLVADNPEHLVLAPRWAAAALILLYGVAVVAATWRARGRPVTVLMLASAGLTVLAFPFPLRSGPASIRFLTPAYLPVVVVVAAAALASGNARRAWLLVLSLSCLHLIGARGLLLAWRGTDRTRPPFLLPDLAPVLRTLESRGHRRAYASYGPAYRLTYLSGEAVIVSQPWNERFLHHPLPYLDEVRFAKSVAWVLTPDIPSELPGPVVFEAALAAAGGRWSRTQAGPAVVYLDFVPPFGPHVEPLAVAGPAGDGDPSTALRPRADAPTVFALPSPRPLDALTLVAGADGPALLRSMDVEVSADGAAFETVARRRRREERADLRWVNGHPQYVIDHDLVAVPLGGRTVAAVRITPVASGDPWSLGELLLHPAGGGPRLRWDEWLDPRLSWPERWRHLRDQPRPDREDWYYRWLLARRTLSAR